MNELGGYGFADLRVGMCATVATLRPRVNRETGDSPDRNDSGPFPACSTPSMPLVSPRRTFRRPTRVERLRRRRTRSFGYEHYSSSPSKKV